jgi:hypothetical protein
MPARDAISFIRRNEAEATPAHAEVA